MASTLEVLTAIGEERHAAGLEAALRAAGHTTPADALRDSESELRAMAARVMGTELRARKLVSHLKAPAGGGHPAARAPRDLTPAELARARDRAGRQRDSEMGDLQKMIDDLNAELRSMSGRRSESAARRQELRGMLDTVRRDASRLTAMLQPVVREQGDGFLHDPYSGPCWMSQGPVSPPPTPAHAAAESHDSGDSLEDAAELCAFFT
eukprot:TRINITY_DN32539_c0_g1_i1.p1 TRINITY_DN32539_c0_g1~~TRINITY_DN32539_c0_g1_i1.p1  ORF type:complete len:229 (+),score=49.54 TRINITY_DN32539_c0_g1_i1:62-688(+)